MSNLTGLLKCESAMRRIRRQHEVLKRVSRGGRSVRPGRAVASIVFVSDTVVFSGISLCPTLGSNGPLRCLDRRCLRNCGIHLESNLLGKVVASGFQVAAESGSRLGTDAARSEWMPRAVGTKPHALSVQEMIRGDASGSW